jgi:hypothetical protein
MKVWGMLEDPQDQTFASYKVSLPAPENITLLDGLKDAKSHIQVCYDPKAREIDKKTCAHIGGHIHIATITPDGFQWVIPPVNVSG